MQYRPEIDGLRAIAVVPVIFFHAGFSAFSGGFVGVDVFFVISGYLITSIILSEKSNGTFRLLNFYERRARRILPALFLVLFISSIFAYFWLMPDDLKEFADSIAAVATFSSNFLFWRESNYFATASELKPLLHTWSLAVEEQYYVLFPLFMIVAWRLGKRGILLILGITAILSLSLAQWGAFYKPTATFFLLPTRAWELLLGVFTAFYLFKKEVKGSQSLSLIGILLIAYSIFAFNQFTPYPSLYALVPTLGTALIILFTSSETIVHRVLSSRLLVGIGLISYSAYLWHQPIFAFARHRDLNEPSVPLMIFLAFSSLAFGYISWRYVEKPFRNRKLIRRQQIFAISAVGTCVFITLGVIGNLNGGFDRRFSNETILASIHARRNVDHAIISCLIEDGKRIVIPNQSCWFGKGKKKILVWGDSHSDSTAQSLARELTDSKIYEATYSACPPALGVRRIDSRISECRIFNDTTLKWAKTQGFDAIVLSARWRFYMQGKGYDNHEGGVEKKAVVIDGIERKGNLLAKNASPGHVLTRGIEKLAQEFPNIPVFLVYQIPEAGWDVPSQIFKLSLFDKYPGRLSTSYKLFLADNSETKSALDAVKSANIYRIYPSDVLCDRIVKSRCVLAYGSSIYYSDHDHVTTKGARLLVKYYGKIIRRVLD